MYKGSWHFKEASFVALPHFTPMFKGGVSVGFVCWTQFVWLTPNRIESELWTWAKRFFAAALSDPTPSTFALVSLPFSSQLIKFNMIQSQSLDVSKKNKTKQNKNKTKNKTKNKNVSSALSRTTQVNCLHQIKRKKERHFLRAFTFRLVFPLFWWVTEPFSDQEIQRPISCLHNLSLNQMHSPVNVCCYLKSQL